MHLLNGMNRILGFVDLEDGERDLFASVGFRVERAKGDLFSCDIVVGKSLDDVFKTAPDVGHDERVRANLQCRLTAGWGAYGTHCARARCVKAALVEIVQRFQHFVACVEKVEVTKDLTLISNAQFADKDLARHFSTRQAVIV